MSYYKGSGFSGRGGSGGYRGGGSSYRGGRGEGSSGWRGSRSYGSPGRGGASGSGGKYYDNVPSYESRSKAWSPSSDRYSGRSRDDYRFSNQSDSVGYAGRFNRSSPEPPRKRLRESSSSSYGMASRRSHERSFSFNEYSGRSFYDKGAPGGGYMTEKGSYREVRETRPNDYSFRKPPSHSTRGSMRGRSTRGMIRRGFRSGTGSSMLTRKKLGDSYSARKRITTRSREYYRRLKHYRLKRSSLKDDDDDDDDDKKKESDDEQEDDDVEKDDEDDEDDEEGVEEEEEAAVEEDEESAKEEETKNDEAEKEKDPKEDEAKTEKEGEIDNKKEVITPKKVVKKKKVIKKKKSETKETEDVKEEVPKEDEAEKPLASFVGQPSVQLKCPHCGYKGSNFKDYSKHLSTKKHTSAMQALSSCLRTKLTTMRIEQRVKQRTLDMESKSKNLRLTTFFCTICKLNYRTLKSAHQNSVSHKKMKAFVLPYCTICNMNFKSPWTYESHLCEPLHIKRKARTEKLSRPPIGQEDEEGAQCDLDTSHFMVLDAVGSGDDASSGERSDDEHADGDDAEKGEDSEKRKKKKTGEIKLGAEHCKLVEVYFCELCKIYLSRNEDKEKTLTVHCRSRTHLQRYVRHRDDKSLRRKAVRLHKEHEKEKEQLKKKDDKTDNKTEEHPEGEKKTEEEAKEKIWSAFEKSLSDLLHDEEPAEEANEDDDDSRQEGERYDRFKQSDDKPNVESPPKTGTATNGDMSPNEKKDIEASN